MSFGTALRALVALVEHWEDRQWEVTSVGGRDGTLVSEGGLDAAVTVRATFCDVLAERSAGPVTLRSVDVNDSGVTVDLDAEVAISSDGVPDGLSVSAADASVVDGDLVVVLDVACAGRSGDVSAASTVDEAPVSSVDDDADPAPAPSSPSDRADDNPDVANEAGDDPDVANEADDNPDVANEVNDDSGGVDVNDDSGGVDVNDDSGGVDEADDSSADDSGIERHRPDVPPFEDTDYLREIYDTCDTFVEMADVIDMAVTSETVRRYMIGAGIHEPASYDTSRENDEADETAVERERAVDDEVTSSRTADERTAERTAGSAAHDGDEPVLVADGIGLPDGVTVEEFIDVITKARTPYEVQRQLDIERGAVQNLLQEHNLLDLVMGQIAMEARRTVTREDVIERLRDSVSP